MAKLTWLGSEDYREGESPLESCTWNGVLFTAGDKVEVKDEWMITKARGNRFFRVEEPAPLQSPQVGELAPPQSSQPAPLGPARPEMWTSSPADENEPWPDIPPDYPPEDQPDREPKKRRGRPPRIRDNGDGNQ